MNVELTEKEAKEIYVQRYYDNIGRKRLIPFLLLGLTLVLVVTLFAPGREWLVTGLAMIPCAISLYISYKASRKSKVYAVEQMMVK